MTRLEMSANDSANAATEPRNKSQARIPEFELLTADIVTRAEPHTRASRSQIEGRAHARRFATARGGLFRGGKQRRESLTGGEGGFEIGRATGDEKLGYKGG